MNCINSFKINSFVHIISMYILSVLVNRNFNSEIFGMGLLIGSTAGSLISFNLFMYLSLGCQNPLAFITTSLYAIYYTWADFHLMLALGFIGVLWFLIFIASAPFAGVKRKSKPKKKPGCPLCGKALSS